MTELRKLGGVDASSGIPSEPKLLEVDAILVHYRSDGLLLDLLADLASQEDVVVHVHIIECGRDGTLERLADDQDLDIRTPGQNLGYTGGNNLALPELSTSGRLVLVINPDVRLSGTRCLTELANALLTNPRLAALAPTIRTPKGLIEYTDSLIDLDTNRIEHTGTNVDAWPPESPECVDLSWIDGSCILFRGEALADVGLFDEQFFLFAEEVDWCMRAGHQGWRLAVHTRIEITHTRSASFGNSPKGAYYYWRNRYLLGQKYKGFGPWILPWLRSLVRFCITRNALRTRQSLFAIRGAIDAIRSRGGRMPRDE